jgi:hypothetical protein
MPAPGRPGKSVDEIYVWQNSRGTAKEYWRWDGSQWLKATGPNVKINKELLAEQQGGTLAYTNFGTPTGLNTSLRYPRDAAMAKESDYVLFEFYKYSPPFKGLNTGATKDQSQGVNPGLSLYNRSVTEESRYEKIDGLRPIILYMPEDISTGYKANWTGKAFSNMGRDALAIAGSGDLGQAAQNSLTALGDAWTQFVQNTSTQIISETISKITGESLEPNDIFAATRGVILNPNVELLFGGIDLRNFSLRYKLVPRNKPEADNIREIINVFRKAMLPSFSTGKELPLGAAITDQNNIATNFIQVPNVCRVSFMKGGRLNEYVPQYKMCAITQVDINYTPDGTYSTYSDGEMVAIELSLAFQETKLIFAEEVEKY